MSAKPGLQAQARSSGVNRPPSTISIFDFSNRLFCSSPRRLPLRCAWTADLNSELKECSSEVRPTTPCVRIEKWSESAAGIDGSATRIESPPLFVIRLQVPVLSVAFRPGEMCSRLGSRRVQRPECLFLFHGGARQVAEYNPRFLVHRFQGRSVKEIPATTVRQHHR